MTGFIVLDKPEDITSFLCVAKVRRIMGERKAGHCGTLDPMATGVLPIMLGGATRFLEFLPDSTKRYTAVMRLGIKTDTLDITGQVLDTCDVDVGFDEVARVAENYKGDIMQVPPMYSALNKDGVKLYKLARQGIEVEREARPV
ncbi:MAG: tRNA pseudouridine(55) synthase TruB, partial [Clostridia bacterium]|nr:tRNA pseudouridine(55) synthase TruB [Clostridia bacterium]